MAKQGKKQRGVYPHPERPNTFCILYYDQFGKRHREVVGSKQAAINAYQKRKTAVREFKFAPQRTSSDGSPLSERLSTTGLKPLKFSAHTTTKGSGCSGGESDLGRNLLVR